MTKRKFTPEEDSKLCELVKENGAKNWNLIAIEIPGRTGRQCRDRYQNYLVPGYFNGQWTQEEDDLLFIMFHKYGNQWTYLKKFFPGRTANCIKNRWNYFVCRYRNQMNQQQRSLYQHPDSNKNVSTNQIDNSQRLNNNIPSVNILPNQVNHLNTTKKLEIRQIDNNDNNNKEKIAMVNEGTQTKESSLLNINVFLQRMQ